VSSNQAYSVAVSGTVQGVGFRPFLFRLAKSLQLVGTVKNTSGGLLLHIEGPPQILAVFLHRLRQETPEAAQIERLNIDAAVLRRDLDFQIVPSAHVRLAAPSISPDLATCPGCLTEMLNARDRRYLYPFITCTECGPRFSICDDIPYDRSTTTMHRFVMCGECQLEYDSPSNRRLHAQANACPLCGPCLSVSILEVGQDIRSGRIVALKGIGGFQLLADARNENAIQRLRERKARDAKPLAIMMPTMESVARYCHISPDEARALRSREAPIVLLRRFAEGDLPWRDAALFSAASPSHAGMRLSHRRDEREYLWRAHRER
jgi:hydrogenase maturation protein HypF